MFGRKNPGKQPAVTFHLAQLSLVVSLWAEQGRTPGGNPKVLKLLWLKVQFLTADSLYEETRNIRKVFS